MTSSFRFATTPGFQIKTTRRAASSSGWAPRWLGEDPHHPRGTGGVCRAGETKLPPFSPASQGTFCPGLGSKGLKTSLSISPKTYSKRKEPSKLPVHHIIDFYFLFFSPEHSTTVAPSRRKGLLKLTGPRKILALSGNLLLPSHKGENKKFQLPGPSSTGGFIEKKKKKKSQLHSPQSPRLRFSCFVLTFFSRQQKDQEHMTRATGGVIASACALCYGLCFSLRGIRWGLNHICKLVSLHQLALSSQASICLGSDLE